MPAPWQERATGAALDILLQNSQTLFHSGGGTSFIQVVTRVNAAEGLQQAGTISQPWDPSISRLTINWARILRGGKVIDLLAGQDKFTTLRRETNLEAATLDGQLTATLQPQGLEVGDVLEYAVTLDLAEPALGPHAAMENLVEYPNVTILRQHVVYLWPQSRSMTVWRTDDVPALAESRSGGLVRAALDRDNVDMPDAPKGAPPFESLRGVVSLTDFSSWAEVSSQFAPSFAAAERLSPDSPLKAEIARIAAASPDSKSRALAALQLVENQVRYLNLTLNAGGLTPASADLTWSRRFGDCKGKTVLLLALLHGLGIDAQAVLVSSNLGDAIDRMPPSPIAFDHVLVRARIGEKTYWLDGTRLGDASLDTLQTPNLSWGLPIQAADALLIPMKPEPLTRPAADVAEMVDLSAGMDKPAAAELDLEFHGDVGQGLDLALTRLGQIDQDKVLKRMLAAEESWIAFDSASFTYDAKAQDLRVKGFGHGTPPFVPDGSGGRTWSLDLSAVGYSPDFERPSPFHRDAPFAVAYPSLVHAVIGVTLPNKGRGFSLGSSTYVNTEAGGMLYRREANLIGDKVTVTTVQDALTPTFPATEAKADGEILRQISSYPVALTYSPAQ